MAVPHPACVLQFMPETTANRLCQDYESLYGNFVEGLFDFVWSRSTLNARVRLEGPVHPACITVRYVDDRRDGDCGSIPSLGKCVQDVELLRWIRFRKRGGEVEIGRYFTDRTAACPYNGWRRDAFIVHSYAEALADTIMDYRFLELASHPWESQWQPPPDCGPIPDHILAWRKGNLLER